MGCQGQVREAVGEPGARPLVTCRLTSHYSSYVREITESGPSSAKAGREEQGGPHWAGGCDGARGRHSRACTSSPRVVKGTGRRRYRCHVGRRWDPHPAGVASAPARLAHQVPDTLFPESPRESTPRGGRPWSRRPRYGLADGSPTLDRQRRARSGGPLPRPRAAAGPSCGRTPSRQPTAGHPAQASSSWTMMVRDRRLPYRSRLLSPNLYLAVPALDLG